MRLKAYVSWPDGGLGWLPGALLAAFRTVRRERPDVLFSSSAPYAGHLVALVVHRLTGIPWVADFRDEWAENPHLASQPGPLKWLARRIERMIARDAATLVAAADYFRLAGGAPFETITNGVDPADVPQTPATPPTDRFRLCFVGTLYGTIDLAPVLVALRHLIADGDINSRRFELRIVGGIWLTDFRAPDGVTVTQTGYVAHGEAVAEMRSATALLLFVPEESLAPSGKIFEYLAAERPVLCVTRPDNLAARLVTCFHAGATAPPGDPVAIAAALHFLYAQWEADELAAPGHARERVLERYSRRELTRRLADVLDSAVGR
jgi:glycosyltransferase involved in cell wall biosynthesis